MTISSTELDFTMPSGLCVKVEVPARHEIDIVELGLRAFMGSLVALSKTDNEETRRAQLLSFVGALLALSENTVKRVLFANETSKAESGQIIDHLLKSLNPPEAAEDG